MHLVPPWLTPTIIAVVFAAMLLGEWLAPLRAAVEPKGRRVVRNLTAGGISLLAMAALQPPLLIPVAALVQEQRIGVLQWLGVPRPWSIVLAVLLLDYTLWVWHWANHRVPFLWRFHLVHHVDRDLDTSTALRFHFGELALSVPVRAAQIALIGAEPLAVAIWQAVLFASILFHHSNLRLPYRLESFLVHLIVTPRMHGIHHSQSEEETNSNWSSLLTVWDFLHRTFRFDVPQESIAIGVPAWRNPRDVTIGRLLLMPFRRQREDWQAVGAERPLARSMLRADRVHRRTDSQELAMEKKDYGIRVAVPLDYDEAVAKTKEALQQEGFGVLSEIDIAAKLKEKLGVDFKRYVILGACNPALAHKALQAEPEIGLLLPCNVIVYDAGDGKSVVSAVDPDSMLRIVGDNAAVAEVATDARARLERAIAAVAKG